MRRGLLTAAALFLSGALISLVLGGCASHADRAAEDHYALYFLEKSLLQGNLDPIAGKGALRAVSTGIPSDSRGAPQEMGEMLLAALLRGPVGEDGLENTIPGGTELLSLELRGSRAVADFSAPYGSLSGVALTLADYAVTLTLTQIPEISLVQITVEGQALSYRDKQSFTARDVLLLPEGDVVETIEAELYFPDAEGTLTAQERTLSIYEGDTQVEAVVQAVEGGPEGRDLSPALPEGFRVRSVRLDGDICFVNLSSALLEGLDSAALSLALRAMDQSLCSLENVREVRWLVDGALASAYGGVSLAEPYGPVEG